MGKGRKAEPFWDKVAIADPDECWLWQRAKSADGYGNHGTGGKNYRAHRFAYELAYGPIPEGALICHACDNPLCVNPAHLFVGSYLDNATDRTKKGRSDSRQGEKNHNAKLSESHVREIRDLYATGQYTQKALSEMYKVTPRIIYCVVHRETWEHLP